MAYGIVNADQIGTSVAGSNLGAGNASLLKNRLINGNMVIDQRNAGASVTLPDGAASGAYPVDRFYCSRATGATATGQQSSSAPVGFNNSFVITNGTGISVASTAEAYIIQFVEGYNAADLQWGTANAKTVTLSFWVQSSITGTHSGSLFNASFNRSYPFSYTISSANTWTQISVTIAGDTTGTWGTTNGRGIAVCFNNGAGSNWMGTAGAWTGSGKYGVTGSVALNSVTGSTWYVTGVQLEVGSSATGFEYRQYGQEMALCQRYFFKITSDGTQYASFAIGYVGSTTSFQFEVPYPVKPRTSCTGITATSAGSFLIQAWNNFTPSAIQFTRANTNLITCEAISSGMTQGYGGHIIDANNACAISFNGMEL